MHRIVRVMVRLFTVMYLLFLLVSQVHSPTTAFFTATSIVEGAVTAGNDAEEASVKGEGPKSEEAKEKVDTPQQEVDKTSSSANKTTDKQAEEETSKQQADKQEPINTEKEAAEDETKADNVEKGQASSGIEKEEKTLSGGEETEHDSKEDG